MQLYYAPGACSLAPHIVLREAGLPADVVKVDLAARQTADGADYLQVSPNGYVPALRLDDGQVLTEAQVILQYLADRKPEAGLAPPAGGLERYRLQEALGFIATELHKGFGPLWNPAMPEAAKQLAREKLAERLSHLNERLGTSAFVFGDRFTVADAYAFTVANWTNVHKIELGPWPNLRAYMARIGERPAVRAALEAEGLA